jgi:hypothetical protein
LVKVHNLKTLPEHFANVKAGIKNFELRCNDRDFEVGDWLVLDYYDPDNGGYNGEALLRPLDYMLVGPLYGLAENFAILSWNLEWRKSALFDADPYEDTSWMEKPDMAQARPYVTTKTQGEGEA